MIDNFLIRKRMQWISVTSGNRDYTELAVVTVVEVN